MPSRARVGSLGSFLWSVVHFTQASGICSVRLYFGRRWYSLKSLLVSTEQRSSSEASHAAFSTGVKLEDAEVRSVASNQSEMEFSSLHDVVSDKSLPSQSLL